MSDDLHNHDELIGELNKRAIRTTQGSYVKMDDVEELIKKRAQAEAVNEATAPAPKTVEAAREQAKKFLKSQDFGPNRPLEPGRSVSAQPSSRT